MTATINSYSDFLNTKRKRAMPVGIEAQSTNSALYPFQKQCVDMALRRGRCALFEDCGLGKTLQQLAWAESISSNTSKPSLILAPLAVAQQTAREGKRFGIPVTVCRHQDDVKSGLNIANYEMLKHFSAGEFGSIVLDESSILKAYEGSIRKEITDFARAIPFRLCCTATPAPNDLIEIINHAEFLEIMGGKEIIATYFIQDGNTTHAYRLKRHAVEHFWRWVASWAVAVRKPSDIGFDDAGFDLPPLSINHHIVPGEVADGFLFPIEAQTLGEQSAARRESMEFRVKRAVELATSTHDPVIVWCHYNAESEALTKGIPGAVEVAGAHSNEHKERAMMGFADGSIRVLVTKPSIAGFGMNWQHCNRVIFAGVSHSYEQFYQAIRRCWRFGQTRPVSVDLLHSEAEGAVVNNIMRKQRDSEKLFSEIVKHFNAEMRPEVRTHNASYKFNVEVPSWL